MSKQSATDFARIERSYETSDDSRLAAPPEKTWEDIPEAERDEVIKEFQEAWFYEIHEIIAGDCSLSERVKKLEVMHGRWLERRNTVLRERYQ